MLITILCSLMLMLGYFLMLFGAVAFIQDKRLFSSAPKEIQAVIPETRPEKFRGQHVVGWLVVALAALLFIGAVVLAAWDGVVNRFGFLGFFLRFFVMLYAMEIYDIVFFDWVLLCHSNFYPRYCPECAGLVGPQLFGFNKQTHIMHFVVYIPLCAIAAWLCTLL